LCFFFFGLFSLCFCRFLVVARWCFLFLLIQTSSWLVFFFVFYLCSLSCLAGFFLFTGCGCGLVCGLLCGVVFRCFLLLWGGGVLLVLWFGGHYSCSFWGVFFCFFFWCLVCVLGGFSLSGDLSSFLFFCGFFGCCMVFVDHCGVWCGLVLIVVLLCIVFGSVHRHTSLLWVVFGCVVFFLYFFFLVDNSFFFIITNFIILFGVKGRFFLLWGGWVCFFFCGNWFLFFFLWGYSVCGGLCTL